MQPYLQPVVSNPATQFLEGIAQDGMSATYSLNLPSSSGFWMVRAFSIVSVQNLSWELRLYSRADPNATGIIGTENFVAAWQFPALMAGNPGYPVTDDGLFCNYIDGNLIPYRDLDVNTQGAGPAHLHMRLINRSATAKDADEAGAVLITAYCSPMGMQV